MSALPGTSFAKGPLAAPVSPNESQLQSHGHYRNRSGTEVHSPSASRSGGVPAGASAHCRDGTYSFSQHRSGTCSGHHGVAEWE
ncbi:MAG: DUF3761 domain-containing protein [Janthinobacterium lividum]